MKNDTTEFEPKFIGMKEKDIFKIKYKDDYICVYDKEGNEIYYENSYGYWLKQEYDKKGNEIYFESSNGYWLKREYDKKGEMVSRTEGGKLKLEPDNLDIKTLLKGIIMDNEENKMKTTIEFNGKMRNELVALELRLGLDKTDMTDAGSISILLRHQEIIRDFIRTYRLFITEERE